MHGALFCFFFRGVGICILLIHPIISHYIQLYIISETSGGISGVGNILFLFLVCWTSPEHKQEMLEMNKHIFCWVTWTNAGHLPSPDRRNHTIEVVLSQHPEGQPFTRRQSMTIILMVVSWVMGVAPVIIHVILEFSMKFIPTSYWETPMTMETLILTIINHY